PICAISQIIAKVTADYYVLPSEFLRHVECLRLRDSALPLLYFYGHMRMCELCRKLPWHYPIGQISEVTRFLLLFYEKKEEETLTMDIFLLAVALYQLSFKIQPFLPSLIDINIDRIFPRKLEESGIMICFRNHKVMIEFR